MKRLKKYTALICACLVAFGNVCSVMATENNSVITKTQEEGKDYDIDSMARNADENSTDIANNESEQEVIHNDENEITDTESDELQDEEQIDILGTNGLSYADTCLSPDDIKEYTFKVDYSVIPDVRAAIVRTGDGDIKVAIKNEQGNQVLSFYCMQKDQKSVIDSPKKWGTLDKPEGDSDQYTFTVSISSNTSSSFCFSVGSASGLPNMLGGDDKVTPIAKYQGSEQAGYTNYVAMRNYLPGVDAPDFYRYIATDRNIIETYTSTDNSIGFTVIDEETKTIIYQTTAEDETVEKIGTARNAYHVRYDGRDMVTGKSYIIQIYARNGYSLEKSYNLYVGNPQFYIGGLKSDVSATSSGTITSTRDTWFTFDVSGAPKGAYVTQLYLYVGGATHRGEYSVISPNGKTYYAKHVGSGIYEGYIKIPFDAINYDGGSNALANGVWMLSIRSPKGSYSVRPRINLDYKYMSGVEDIN